MDRSSLKKKKQAAFLKKLELFRGNISKTCKALKINVASYYQWRKEEDFKVLADDILLAEFEKVEQKMLEMIDKGSENLTKFYISSKAHAYPDKGYTPVNTYNLDHTTKGEKIEGIQKIEIEIVKKKSEDDENQD